MPTSPRSSTTGPAAGDDPVRWLLEVSHTLPPVELGTAVGQAMAGLGAIASCIYLVDHDHLRMHPFGPDVDGQEAVGIDTTMAGRAFVAGEVTQVATATEGVRLWVPLIDGTARLGVVAVDLPEGRTDDETVRAVEELASLAALLVITKGHYTDAMEQVRRRRTMTLAAELQRSSLPPVALVTSQVAVAGMLQPAYEVAGDTFDYALDAEGLHVAVVDSVGHDLNSSMISHLVQGSLRNSRRNGLDLAEGVPGEGERVVTTGPTDGQRHDIAPGLSGYVLPGASVRWVLPATIAARDGHFQARINGEATPRTLGAGR